MISFDIRDSPDVGKGVVMFLLLDYVYTQMKKSRSRKILVIDEAWTVLSAGEQAEYILRLVKTCRKFNLALVMITQDVEDVLISRAGRAVLTNTATKLLLKQDTSVIEQIAERFNLNMAEVRFVKVASMGHALLIAENTRIPIYVTASPEEHRIITTRPDEMQQLADVKRPEGVDLVKEFDINRPVHRKSELSDQQILALSQRNFEELRIKTLSGDSELFLVRNETDETDDHFVMQHLIVEEVSRYSNKVLMHHTRLPDITFETNLGKIIACEIEADVGLKRSIETLQEKHNILKKYDDYFIVTTNPVLKRDYSEEFGDIIMREEIPSKIATYF